MLCWLLPEAVAKRLIIGGNGSALRTAQPTRPQLQSCLCQGNERLSVAEPSLPDAHSKQYSPDHLSGNAVSSARKS